MRIGATETKDETRPSFRRVGGCGTLGRQRLALFIWLLAGASMAPGYAGAAAQSPVAATRSAPSSSAGASRRAPAARPRPQQSSQLQEVIVQATKRSEPLQNVPISITAFSSAQIAQNHLVTIANFADRVPGLTYIHAHGNETEFEIRGIATIDDSTGTDQPVLLFVDGVGSTGVADVPPDLFDVNHVEVLKGPQGTLFGRNAAGGVISIFTNDPTFTTAGKAELTYGQYNLFEVNGMFNAPIIADKLAGRIVVTTHNRDAYVNDVTTGGKIGAESNYALRGKLLFTPVENLRAVMELSYLRDKSSLPGWISGDFHPSLDPDLSYSPTSTFQLFYPRTSLKNWGVTATVDWMTGVGKLTSITAYRKVSAENFDSFTLDPANVVLSRTASSDEQLSEEVRLASPSDRRFTWLGGVYYLHLKRSRPNRDYFSLLPGSLLSLIAATPVFTAAIDQNTTVDSPAVFGTITYDIVPGLKASLGARYTTERKAGHTAINPATLFSGGPISADYSHRWSAFTPKFTLSYKPVDSLMTYATVARGFQSGGFNAQGSTEEALRTPFNAENVLNYELGGKYYSPNHRLQADIAVFLSRYTQLQIIEFNGSVYVTTNAGSAEIKGVEADFTASPVDWLTLGANLAGLHSRFTSYVINNGPGVPPTVNTGNRIPFVPPFTITLSAELNFDTPRLGGRIAFGGDYTYRDAMELNVENNELQAIRDLTVWHGVVNLNASWTDSADEWRILFWGHNVTKKRFTAGAGPLTIFYATPGELSDPTNYVNFLIPNAVPSFGVTVSVKM